MPGLALKKAGNSWYNGSSKTGRRYVQSGFNQTPGSGSFGGFLRNFRLVIQEVVTG